ncbi:Rho termination protein [Listeria monocytogenes]|uniref:Rho termination protein n=1 Tax=Listeria TaxID=1637 RepID=UPI000F2B8C2E|nr:MULTISPECIES: Rho termination protein [Listeria]EAC2921713.1 Rho termination protein [Listeria monocytogenes]EAC3423680.1 Rho termination protein [Listeria monocytogenes]EAD1842022.1 Rho termination protein [Listeria monocytogenes]EAD2103846.1 Rho termination protein [Listeria monocytogenes]EAD3070671.1 Rho termination protein [Listeria monocytogenes]
MGYTVLKDFTDLSSNHIYREGDKFPREGEEVTEERLAELSGSDNKRGEPMIEKLVAEDEVNEESFPEALPGGYYLLSDGSKVRGKEAAQKAEDKLVSE